jgi:hypothetical protein
MQVCGILRNVFCCTTPTRVADGGRREGRGPSAASRKHTHHIDHISNDERRLERERADPFRLGLLLLVLLLLLHPLHVLWILIHIFYVRPCFDEKTLVRRGVPRSLVDEMRAEN